ISASDTPKSRLETSSLPPVSTPPPPPPPAPKPLSKRSCCHLSGSYSLTRLYGAGLFLPPRLIIGLVLRGPLPIPPRAPRAPLPPLPRPAIRWLWFILMISSRDMSILSPILAYLLCSDAVSEPTIQRTGSVRAYITPPRHQPPRVTSGAS
uniref:Uncharacterized protein n=1 Tax=Leptobrachium leishanense TaxID=445787 RepID=A0A8C5QIC1_9ANUR